MLTQEDAVQIHASAARGWAKAAIASGTSRDRQTVDEVPGPSGGWAITP